MYYSSTRGGDNNQKFVDVLLNGLANDGGLYVPDKIPKIRKNKFEEYSKMTYGELAYEVTKDFVDSEDIPLKSYKEICHIAGRIHYLFWAKSHGIFDDFQKFC